MQPLERSPRTRHAVAGTVDDAGGMHVDDPRRGERDAPRRVQRRDEPGQPVWGRHRIVVEKSENPPARLAHARVVAAGKAKVRLERDHAHPRKVRPDEVNRPIGRRVVHQDGLGLHAPLRRDSGQAGIEMLAAVPRDDDDGRLGTTGHRTCAAWQYTSSVSRAVRFHVNSEARARPRDRNCARRSSSLSTPTIASVQAFTSSGSSRIPASPTTSGMDAARDAITGVPHAIASSTGRPNPSYNDGYTSAAAHWYNVSSRVSLTGPRRTTASGSFASAAIAQRPSPTP